MRRLCRLAVAAATRLRPTAVRHNADATTVTLELRALKARCEALESEVKVLSDAAQTHRLIEFFSSLQRTRLRLEEIVEKCQDPTYRPCIFVHRELPVIFAQLVMLIDKMPSGLFAMQSVRKVRRTLTDSFLKVTEAAVPVTPDEEKAFLKIVMARDEAHESVVEDMALGVRELRQLLAKHRVALGPSHAQMMLRRKTLDSNIEFQAYLDAFYLLFLRGKFLMRQLVDLMDARNNDKDVVGVVNTRCDLVEVCKNAIAKAEQICNQEVGDCPDIQLQTDGVESECAHLSDHLQYIVVELLKNALRATIEQHMERNDCGLVRCDNMPPVVVRISAGDQADYATITVCDEGGGIARRDMGKIMCYTFTTANWKKSGINTAAPEPRGGGAGAKVGAMGDEDNTPTALAGYGYGLPMSRIYARMFGGDVMVASVEGFGTNAHLHVRRSNATVPLAQRLTEDARIDRIDVAALVAERIAALPLAGDVDEE